MVVNIKRLLLFICLFFLFNTLEADSNSDKLLFYDKKELYDENIYNVYFINTNSIKLENVINILDIEVLSYTIDNHKYYASNISELTNKYLIDKSINEELYYNEYGIKIDGITVLCTNEELIKLENMISIY